MARTEARWWQFDASWRGLPFLPLRVGTSRALTQVVHRTILPDGLSALDDWAGEVESIGPEQMEFEVEGALVLHPTSLALDNPVDEARLPEDQGGSPVFYTRRYRARPSAVNLSRRRLELQRAFDAPGVGILVHPTQGEMRCHVRDYTFSENSDEPNVVRFTASFLRAPLAGLGLSAAPVNFLGSEPLQPAQAQAAVTQTLEQELVVEGPEEVRTATADVLTQVARALEGLDVFTGPAQAAAELGARIKSVVNTASTLATAPADAVLAIAGTLQSVVGAVEGALGALEAYREVARVAGSLVASLSSSGAVADRNRTRMAVAWQVLALERAALIVGEVAWATLDDALEERERLRALLNSAAINASDVELEAIARLRAQVVNAVPPPDQNLPRLVRVQLRSSAPAVVTAWRLHADVQREQELIARNRIENPMFVRPGELVVLDA